MNKYWWPPWILVSENFYTQRSITFEVEIVFLPLSILKFRCLRMNYRENGKYKEQL